MDLRIVPWTGLEEFNFAKEALLSDDPSLKEIGLEMLSVWRSKVPTLPAGVETTSYLVSALKTKNGSFDDSNKLSLATALVRFVNLVSHLGQNSTSHQNITDVAIAMNVPEWLVGLRHDVTHGQMPSTESLVHGAKDAMKWLKENYWELEESRLRDWFFVKEQTSRRKKKKCAAVTWRNLKCFKNLHEALDLHFFLLDLAAAEVYALGQLSDPTLKSKVLESLEKQEILPEDYQDTPDLSRGVLDHIISELEALCEANKVGEVGTVLAQLVHEGNYLLEDHAILQNQSRLSEKYRYLFKKFTDLKCFPILMTELARSAAQGGVHSEAAADWFVEVGKSLLGSGVFKLKPVRGFDWLSLGRELIETPSEATKKCLDMLFDLRGIPRGSSNRQSAFTLLDLKINGPGDVNTESLPLLNGSYNGRKRTISETSTCSERSDDFQFRDIIKCKEGSAPKDTASYPVGWNSDYRSLILMENSWGDEQLDL